MRRTSGSPAGSPVLALFPRLGLNGDLAFRIVYRARQRHHPVGLTVIEPSPMPIPAGPASASASASAAGASGQEALWTGYLPDHVAENMAPGWTDVWRGWGAAAPPANKPAAAVLPTTSAPPPSASTLPRTATAPASASTLPRTSPAPSAASGSANASGSAPAGSQRPPLARASSTPVPTAPKRAASTASSAGSASDGGDTDTEADASQPTAEYVPTPARASPPWRLGSDKRSA